eukprot:3843424-Prymnesium_polylepis.1
MRSALLAVGRASARMGPRTSSFARAGTLFSAVTRRTRAEQSAAPCVSCGRWWHLRSATLTA